MMCRGYTKMIDLTKEPYAKWLEESLQSMAEQHPKKIAMVCIDEEGNYMSTYYECGPMDLYGMAGSLHAEGMWREIKANGRIIKEIVETADDDPEE